MTPFDRYEVLSFDCYGTLIDWETGIWEALQPLLESNGATVDRSEALAEFGRLETRHQAARPTLPYPGILSMVHRDLAAALSLETTPEMDRAFGESIASWPPFPDSTEALARLGRRYRLVILSNVDRAGFAASQERLGVRFDAVHTAEDVGSYKPDPANFRYLLERVARDFDVGAPKVLHVAQSLFHDHAPAKAAGLATVWIDRQRLSAGGDWGATMPVEKPPTPDHVFFTLSEFADAVEGR